METIMFREIFLLHFSISQLTIARQLYAQIVLKVVIDLKIIYNMVGSINKIVDGISYESSTAFKYNYIYLCCI